MSDLTTHDIPQEIPYGHCHCGCGQLTRLARCTDLPKGRIKGQPVRYIHGHNPYQGSVASRFWKYVTPGPFDACWLWRGAADPNGYGRINARKDVDGWHTELAHRVSWEIHFGPIPDGMFSCHHCDTPACCNPYHLFLGTPPENHADMVKKGRQKGGGPSGESHHHHKLTTQNVLDIRTLAAQGVSYAEIGRRFSIADTTASGIARRKTWRHVP